MNASKATAGHLRLSVRVGGVECGELRLSGGASGRRKERIFTATNASRFSSCGTIPDPGLDWADRAVRQYSTALRYMFAIAVLKGVLPTGRR